MAGLEGKLTTAATKEMEMIVLDKVLGEGSYGTVCTATVNGRQEPGVLKVFTGGLMGGELICPVGLNQPDALCDAAENANAELWNDKLWELLTSVVPEIAARGMGGADVELHLKHYLLYVGGRGVVWGAVMPQVKPMTFEVYASMSEAARLAFVAGLQSALGKVHEHGYIHGDVKPDNVALSADGSRVVLIDFGLVCAAPCVTKGRKSLYSPEFRPPELTCKKDVVAVVTFAADVWAAGVTLLALENGRHNGKSFMRHLKLTSSWEANFELLESTFPLANKRVLSAAASMLIVDAEKRASFVGKPAEVLPVPNYVGLLPYDYTFAACEDMQIIIHAREEHEKQFSNKDVLCNWEMGNLMYCAIDLFTRAYATGKTREAISMRLLNCACLSLASVLSSPGGRFVLMFKDFDRVQPGGLGFTAKELVSAVNLVIEILGGKLLPLGGGVRRQRLGLGNKELTIAEGKALWCGLRVWAMLPLLSC